ncbi:hypothetical protein DEO72_LG5g2217 [Vigna unguiculata]|uniref:Uncharacterized protein n=1 Tax=Vigna unguiculata TaxID=3917 RepID=A0A4D6M0M4_VIGUN|nr:hypothetical protein DEO72_LG5g2217 [Vigna unguiculata]
MRRLLMGALGGVVAWRRGETARRSGTKFRLVTREVRQAVLGAELDREEDLYTALDRCHDAMLC